jgi:glucose-6-phosphate isomerase
MTTWQEFQEGFIDFPELQFSFEYARMGKIDFERRSSVIQSALNQMEQIEKGAIANPDEQRMVGHYWLRAPELAPTKTISSVIDSTINKVVEFSEAVHAGKLVSESGARFSYLLIIGIGGSALGPQFVTHALRTHTDRMDAYFFDNTDPDGMSRVLSDIPSLEKTLVVVISKSGGTKETRNGMLVAQEAFSEAGLNPNSHFIAITGEGSALEQVAQEQKWLAIFPMWDWVGGRTSELSAVGLLPAALQGYRIKELLQGAREMDKQTRERDVVRNPALLMALLWLEATGGMGERALVMLPYKDRFELFSRYLQQLIMESLGKELDLDGNTVNQGISVYGNKGSTDQHAYVQQLRDGVNNFFATFIEVLQDVSTGEDSGTNLEVEESVTVGDYLSGFLQGTKEALHENGRPSLTITVDRVDERTIGRLIALFERAVGYYASFVNINAYHQPGVEAGKRAANEVIALQRKVLAVLNQASKPISIDELAKAAGVNDSQERVFRIVNHLAANKKIVCIERAVSVSDRKYVTK